MNEGALRRIGALLGLLVGGAFGLWEAFSGLVLAHCVGLGGDDTKPYTVEGPWARGTGVVWLLMTAALVWSQLRVLREER